MKEFLLLYSYRYYTNNHNITLSDQPIFKLQVLDHQTSVNLALEVFYKLAKSKFSAMKQKFNPNAAWILQTVEVYPSQNTFLAFKRSYFCFCWFTGSRETCQVIPGPRRIYFIESSKPCFDFGGRIRPCCQNTAILVQHERVLPRCSHMLDL